MQISKLLSALISYLYNIPSIPSTKIYFTIYLVQKHTSQYTQYRKILFNIPSQKHTSYLRNILNTWYKNIHYNILSTETYFSIYLVKNILYTQFRNILNTWYKNILYNILCTETLFSNIPSTETYFSLYLEQKHTLQYTQYRNILYTQYRSIFYSQHKNILYNIPNTETYFIIYPIQKDIT